jgi:hypothetical protein
MLLRIAISGAVFYYEWTFRTVWASEYSKLSNSGHFKKWASTVHVGLVF